MKINRLRLENIRSYEEQTIEFPEGTILIHGENGAGKTSLLMGLFGGLFLSDITNVGSNNFNLSDLVRRGAERGCVELDFEVDGEAYSVEWEMPGEDGGGASSATLTSPSLSEPISGITNVQTEVVNLLGMNEDDFSSSSYIKQGEIDRLIEANDRAAMIDSLLGLDQIEGYIERAKMGRRGANRVYESNKTRRRTQEENLDDHDYDEDGYTEEIQRLNSEISDTETEIEEYEDHLDKLDDGLGDVTDAIDNYEDLSADLSTKQDQIDDAEDNRTETLKSKQESKDAIEEREAKIDDLRDEISDLDTDIEYDLSSAEEAEEALDVVQDDLMDAQQAKNNQQNDYENAKADIEDARGDLNKIENQLETAQVNLAEQADKIETAEATVESHEDEFREQVNGLVETAADFDLDTELSENGDPEVAADALPELAQQTIPDRRDTLGDQINDLSGEIGRLETKAETHDDEIDELRELEDAGECPKCGQNVDEAHVEDEIATAESERDDARATAAQKADEKDDLERRHSQLSVFRDAVNEAISFRNEKLAEARTVVEDARNEYKDIQETIDEHEAEQAELEATIDEHEAIVSERQEAFEQAEAEMEAVESDQSTVQRADRKYDAIERHQNAIKQESQTITHCNNTIETLDKQLQTLRDERDAIQDELGDLDSEALREQKRKFENEIGKWKDKRDEHQSKAEDLRAERTRIDTKLDNLRTLREKIDELERKEQWADSVREDLERSLTIYKEVQSDLRETYLAYINEYTNDIFKDIYKNSSYQQVIITEEYDDTHDTYDYDIRLLRDDGTTEDPANASGGERAVVNLALRAGIYRLIAQIRGADRSTLPPFILDEPTTFLDEGHVGQLEEMLENIKDWDVAQVIVVSHDQSLIHGADHECLVTKDGDSTSSVEMRLAGEDRAESVPGGGEGSDVAISDGAGYANETEEDE